MTKCGQCGAPNVDGRDRCYHCDFQLPLAISVKDRYNNKLPWIIAGVLAIALIIAVAFIFSRPHNETHSPIPANTFNNAQGFTTPQTPKQTNTQKYQNATSPKLSPGQPTSNTNTNSNNQTAPTQNTTTEQQLRKKVNDLENELGVVNGNLIVVKSQLDGIKVKIGLGVLSANPPSEQDMNRMENETIAWNDQKLKLETYQLQLLFSLDYAKYDLAHNLLNNNNRGEGIKLLKEVAASQEGLELGLKVVIELNALGAYR